MRWLLSLALLLALAGPASPQATVSNPIVQTTGSWTPADGSGQSLVFTSVSAAYTRIGNMVFAYGTFTYPSTADAANNATVTGLPFTIPNQNYAATSCASYSTAGAVNVVAAPVVNTVTFLFVNAQTGVVLKNSNLSLQVVHVMCAYPLT